MRIKLTLAAAAILALLTACANHAVNKNDLEMSANTARSAVSPATSPISTPAVSESERQDDSVRAIGTHPTGRLLIKPASRAIAAQLGAPSCYGMETDLRWSGDYIAAWEPTAAGTSSNVMTFPIDFEIIQPNDAPVKMQMFAMGQTDIFAYVPRYTDCHALETYLFGIRDGKAFPITFEVEPGQIRTNIGQLPHRPFQATKDEFIVTGGYGAGQDFIDVYHLHYNSEKHSMILMRKEQIKPSDIALHN